MTDKTEAMDNLIAQDADLIEICPDDLVTLVRQYDIPICNQAADRIEALTAENFKLAAGSCDVEGGKVGDEHGHFYCTLQNKVEAQAAEIERLRKSAECLAETRRLAVKDVAELEAENERLRKALRFYADAKNWAYVKSAGCNCVDADGGDTACAALGGFPEAGQPWLRTYDAHLKGD